MPSSDLLIRYGGNLPRYTSYPTAAQFDASVGADDSEAWLRAMAPGTPLSLYLHVPFCDALCLFCGCNTSVMRDPAGRTAYGALLMDELRRVAGRLGPDHPVRHVQWGGGTPTTLPPETMRAAMQTIRRLFTIERDAEIAIELDPRHMPDAYPDLLRTLGFNRVSLGVQDLDPAVQTACGRIQSRAQTEDCVRRVRAAGIASVNVDLIYGLPYQTVDGAGETAATVAAALRPDRLAVFGYAHVPWKQKRQALLPESVLPGPAERLAQRARIDAVLRAAGYRAIGLDHYARPGDALTLAAEGGTMRRNFQGYTVDPAPVLIGIGASAISSYPQGMTQNALTAAAYARLMGQGTDTLPVVRGVRRTDDDRLRGAVIERLMCDLRVDPAAIGAHHGVPATWFADAMPGLHQAAADGIVTLDGAMIRMTDAGRPFLRNIAALFDAHRAPPGAARHAGAL
ncbi:oxygen-independent coproporphyrinogen III oxidase [Gluconacetobacter diazotrophicus PA1 5]|uniref:Coproporphyrinogen-III oxidase n=3 Tax=Gluconacetobacter diazotrophicus TaxID=33996 RepID=A9HED8_GLUDA|nr:oxygen-independent coproporphyrinogen III oxidase [Gluconacetobacter diazotrophicus]ACI51746.1 oxygen-independent coproporphyrinogen III oxidase [Gluconacetobacter diazotrophicus PA1 5]MBB2155214.1 oxygen-independent coproporphyrinogen III oxidase [Gluconacetobacter diazotrophicus]TWB11090.1 oxygen-independent coproporphyrinogen-3 oxidase [Gluconacetobacter diazotrophicus]CAP55219.1 putative Oxygen-independent coproporphyrinogen III oxidase [Gluconacetobacter diazotrophicus PA1 5]